MSNLLAAKDRIVRLAGQGLDVLSFWQATTEVLAKAVPHYYAPCWHTIDPGTLLITSHFQPGVPELPREWLVHEYYADDVHKMAGVARSARGVSTLHEASGGDPRRSPGWQLYMEPFGAEQEVLVAMRTRAGQAWGMLGLYRETGQPLYSAAELDFLREISPALAEGSRRGLLLGEATDPEGPAAPGLVILRADGQVDSLTPGVERWLAELPDSTWGRDGAPPPAVLAVAGRALRTAEGPDAPGEVALARVLSQSGHWVVLHGAAMTGTGERRVAVIIEPAHPARIASLLMAAYGLTAREQDIARLVLHGNATKEIAATLHVQAQTVQQHLKRIFEKTGVHSRRELAGKIFFAYYEPRLRDNEHRAVSGRPLRGGPLAPQGTPGA